ncbi:MAG: hypothetical protein KBD21_01805 [Candidatus Pacebacteria bacterium]|nr:hypothetical protein [Candidatus Paceibacterota bacterium]
MHNKRKIYATIGVITLLIGASYGYFKHTAHGRLAGLYLVGGWSAPSDVRALCKTESLARVVELFTLPLDMSEDAKQGLREYWHYSYYRECLYHAGYTFMGKPLAQSTLSTSTPNGNLRYTNPLAGISILLPTDATLVTSNELDVTFDYRLLRSTLRFATTTLMVDTYTEHQFIRTFDDLPLYLDHFPASQSAFLQNERRTTPAGIPFMYVEDEDHLCGALFVTPEAHIVHIYAACADRDTVLSATDTLKFEATTASVH